MTKESMGDKKSTDVPAHQMSLSDAVHMVNAAIRSVTEQLTEISKQEEQDPILLVGVTSCGYQVKMMINPKTVAKIMLEYDYPCYYCLQDDAPEEMWEKMARVVGLGEVLAVDLLPLKETNT